MISYQEAQKIIKENARSFGDETLGLADAYGRVLAENILADRDYPPFNRAMMDGYALRLEELQLGRRQFRVAETIFAGASAAGPLRPGEAYKIMTGAPVPDEVDMVIRREDVQELGSLIEVLAGMVDETVSRGPYLNIARQGEDMKGGTTVIDRACTCDPAIIGVLASLGKASVRVQRNPRVALITTGNEIVPVESSVNAVQIRNSNRWLLQSLLKKWNITPAFYQHAPDDRALLRSAMDQALLGELLICCGGVSAGDADYVPEVLESLGVRRLFHKIAIKPGKPVWCGVMPNGGLVFALPGNPFSCMVGFVLLIEPYLRACFGLPEPGPASLPLDGPRKKRTILDEFFPVRLHGAPARLTPVSLNGSGDIRLGMQANALALHPADSQDLGDGAQTIYLTL
jgi:molybdopterin molybdotransferase